MPAPSSPSETAWSLLRAVCSPSATQASLRTLLSTPVQWKFLFELAERHGVQPLLFQSLSQVSELVPAGEMSVLKRSYQTNLHKALFLSRELIRIVDHLSASGIEVVPYKGVALAEAIYGDIALRPSGDIDLLVRAREITRVRQAVRELGYAPHVELSEAEDRAYLKSGYECAFDGTAGPNLLEVQWGIQPRFYAVDFEMEGLFRRALTGTVAGRAMETPCSEDLFLVLALHAAKHVWGRLIWICDLARISSLPTLRWKEIAVQAEELGVARILRVTLLLAEQLLSFPIPAAAEENLPEDPAAMPLAREVEAYITSEAIFDVESFAYFRLMLRMRERTSDRIRFVTRFVLTAGPGEWAAIRLPAALFPLYRIVRITRLGARVIRGRI